MKYKKIYQVEVFLILIILLSSFAYAFGVACQSTAFGIYAGETKTAYFWLQSEPGTENMSVKADIITGQDIASLVNDDIYTVASGIKTEVPVRITIPVNTPADTKYKITLSVSTVTPGDAQAISLGTGIDKSLTVLVIAGEAPKAKIPIIYPIILGILILIIIIILLRRKKRV